MIVDDDDFTLAPEIKRTYQGWVTITTLADGAYTTTKEYKKWTSYCELFYSLTYGKSNIVEIKISVLEEGYKL